MTERKGIILAGGTGGRLYPLTRAVSKQLLPIYDKPMIYYPLSVLMLAGIRDILLITAPEHKSQFKHLLGSGSQWGLQLSYKIQPYPEGLAQAFILAEDFLDGAPSAMILGDNIFFGQGLSKILQSASNQALGATIFGYHVSDPSRYGVIDFDKNGKVKAIIEKPDMPPSNFAVTGLYFVDGSVSERAKQVKPSTRGELEITDLLEDYLNDGDLTFLPLSRGIAWLDTGTQEALLDAGNFVRTLTYRQGLQVGSPDEVAFQMGWINRDNLKQRAKLFKNSSYGEYLMKI